MERIACLIRNWILADFITCSFIVLSRYQVLIIIGGLCAVAEKPWIFILLKFVVKKLF